MRVLSDRRHHFDVAPAELWTAVLAVERYPEWWPWLRSFEANALEEGAEWACVVQPPMPYQVRFTITIDEVRPAELVRATVAGDIEGTATIAITEDGPDRTEAHLTADLGPDAFVLRAMGVAAGPLVRLAHDWVLDTGARQFRHRALPPGD